MPLCQKLVITQPSYTATLRYTLLFCYCSIIDSQNGHTIQRMPNHQTTLTSKTGAATIGTLSTGAIAVGALAIGAFAIGALAIGALAVRKLAIGKAHIRDLHIDRLTVGRLDVQSTGPNAHQTQQTRP